MQMTTLPTGESRIELMAKVKGAKEFKKNSIFGVGWALEYDEKAPKTEAYFAMWSWQQAVMRNDWVNMNVSANLSLDEVKKDPRAAQLQMVPEKTMPWNPTVTKHLGKELHVGAVRNLTQEGRPDRSFKLGETKRWAITFFDMAGPAAFSDIMPLPLSSGFENVDKKEKVKPIIFGKPIKPKEKKKEKKPIIFGKPIPKDKVKPAKKADQKVIRKTTYSATREFDAINASNKCGPKSVCKGYSLKGKYTSRTTATGQSVLDVDATVTAPKPFRKTSNVGVGWGFSWGAQQSSTEVYMALWSFQARKGYAWSGMSLNAPLSIE